MTEELGSGRSLIEIIFRHFPEGSEENQENALKIVGVQAESLTKISRIRE
jgi:hypothetical protein